MRAAAGSRSLKVWSQRCVVAARARMGNIGVVCGGAAVRRGELLSHSSSSWRRGAHFSLCTQKRNPPTPPTPFHKPNVCTCTYCGRARRAGGAGCRSGWRGSALRRRAGARAALAHGAPRGDAYCVFGLCVGQAHRRDGRPGARRVRGRAACAVAAAAAAAAATAAPVTRGVSHSGAARPHFFPARRHPFLPFSRPAGCQRWRARWPRACGTRCAPLPRRRI
jgi:hypothetical protein